MGGWSRSREGKGLARVSSSECELLRFNKGDVGEWRGEGYNAE